MSLFNLNSNSNPVSYWVTWQTNRELNTRTGQTVCTIFCFQKMFKITKLAPKCFIYARNIPGSIYQYKEDGLVSRPPSLLTSMRWPMHGTSCPKSQPKSSCLTAKFGSFLDHTETDEKGQNVISSSVQHPISLIFAIHVSFIIPLPMMWVLLTKPMQKSVITVCLHCSFARLKNKHMGVLGTNVATMSWLHWSPVLGICFIMSVERY